MCRGVGEQGALAKSCFSRDLLGCCCWHHLCTQAHLVWGCMHQGLSIYAASPYTLCPTPLTPTISAQDHLCAWLQRRVCG